MTDPVPPAMAQDPDPASCGTCSGGAMRTVSADVDPAQATRGTAVLGAAGYDTAATSQVAVGPLFITHADTPEGVIYYTVKANESCTFDPTSPTDDVANDPEGFVIPGLGAAPGPHHFPAGGSLARDGNYRIRLRVEADEKLCVKQVASCSCTLNPKSYGERALRWQGFRPYGG
jgi:hypothetical protein